MKKKNCECCKREISEEESYKVKENWKKIFTKLFKKNPTEENWKKYVNNMKQ